MLKGFQKGTATLAQAGKQGIRQMLKFINELLALFAKGGKQLEAFFEKIGKEIAEWFLKNKEKFGNFTKKIIDDLLELLNIKIVKQISDNLDELYKAAEIANKELIEITKEFAKKTGGKESFRDGLKSIERSLEKINSDYLGDASKLLDIAGSKIVYETVDDPYNALRLIKKDFKILRIKDRIKAPLNSGYRDILMNIRMKNKHVVEFRLHLRAMDDAAIEGHKLYQKRRTLDAISKERLLTIDELKLKFDLIKKEKEIYIKAWREITN